VPFAWQTSVHSAQSPAERRCPPAGPACDRAGHYYASRLDRRLARHVRRQLGPCCTRGVCKSGATIGSAACGRYVKHMVHDARQHGLRAVVFNSRGTSDGPVTTPQFYSASYTGDLRAVVAAVQRRYPQSPLLAAGWSLGGACDMALLAPQRGCRCSPGPPHAARLTAFARRNTGVGCCLLPLAQRCAIEHL
jgi:hypothetical protein